MAKKSPSEKLPLDLQECEHVNPQTGLVEYLTALVLSFVNYKNSIFETFSCMQSVWVYRVLTSMFRIILSDYIDALLTEVHHREILGQSK